MSARRTQKAAAWRGGGRVRSGVVGSAAAIRLPGTVALFSLLAPGSGASFMRSPFREGKTRWAIAGLSGWPQPDLKGNDGGKMEGRWRVGDGWEEETKSASG